jgi:hypothetical protein
MYSKLNTNFLFFFSLFTMGKFGEGNFGVDYGKNSDTHTQNFSNHLEYRNSMLNTKHVLSSLL